jgi:hypothetical protein
MLSSQNSQVGSSEIFTHSLKAPYKFAIRPGHYILPNASKAIQIPKKHHAPGLGAVGVERGISHPLSDKWPCISWMTW